LGLEPLGMLHEAKRLATRAPTEVAEAVDHALALLKALPHRIVHGDSHPGNVLWTTDGPLWGDWEDAHLAPRAGRSGHGVSRDHRPRRAGRAALPPRLASRGSSARRRERQASARSTCRVS
jgi:aminoglycoside phosphotransferase (APT) family kinase protein